MRKAKAARNGKKEKKKENKKEKKKRTTFQNAGLYLTMQGYHFSLQFPFQEGLNWQGMQASLTTGGLTGVGTQEN